MAQSEVRVTATILDGRELATRLRVQLTEEAARFADTHDRRARLTLALVGSNPTAALLHRAGRARGRTDRAGCWPCGRSLRT